MLANLIATNKFNSLLFSSLGNGRTAEIKKSLFVGENGRKIKKYIVASVPVVAV